MNINSPIRMGTGHQVDSRLERLLDERMQLPQRHRLLHAYPLLASMPRVATQQSELIAGLDKPSRYGSDADKGLLVGILPHPFCNPTVRGCGFCTFPHEKYRASNARAVVNAVIDEIELRQAADPAVKNRIVHGLYIGGGTANLTPIDSLRDLARTLQRSFDLRQTEVSLEGVPAYFVKRENPMDVLRDELDARHFRISIGIQTFDSKQLERMGRLAFGSPQTFADVVAYAHNAGMTVSGDVMFDLPNQPLRKMKDDVRRSIDLGLDQICLYHLVLFRGLGTEWSRSPKMLSGLPSNARACKNWIVLRHMLLSEGYIQTTLTNFEKKSVNRSVERFNYENFSFRPNRFDMMGFGPSGITFYSNKQFSEAVKTTNLESASDYVARMQTGELPLDRFFIYNQRDLRVFYLTRRLAALGIEEHDYLRQFGVPQVHDFSNQLAVLIKAKLIKHHHNAYVPTPRGMFYADTIASMFTERSKAAFPRIVNSYRLAYAAETQQISNMAGHM